MRWMFEEDQDDTPCWWGFLAVFSMMLSAGLMCFIIWLIVTKITEALI